MRPTPVLLLFLCAAPGARLAAQAPFAACLDRDGQPVRNEEQTDATYPAMAGIGSDGKPVIWWNRPRLATLSEAGRIYIYLHECGHITLRHSYQNASTVEQRARVEREADCWAAQLLAESGQFKPRHFEVLAREWRSASGDQIHLGGERLLAWWRECAAAKTDPKRWRPVLDSLLQSSRDSFAAIAGRVIVESGSEQARETILDPPSVFDCEVKRTGSYACLLFASQDMGPARDRQEKLERIFREWMGGDWTIAVRDAAEGSVVRQFLAEHTGTGTILVLALTQPGRVRLLARPATR
ncbi:MAG: hypothetical protein JNM53_05760 [Gemmatimonadetes bacterium]|nr:hypothetical protein [Gemmatimonadota bacterium]